MTEPIWTPAPDRVKDSQITGFRNYVNSRHNLNLANYDQLYEWSVSATESFWEDIWAFSDIIHSKSYSTILSTPASMLDARWFEGAQLNFAENLLRYQDNSKAITFVQNGNINQQTITYRELYLLVAKFSFFLKKSGIRAGDRVTAFMPNKIETIAAMLATTSIGAIWSSCSPDFGFNGVIQRFEQIEPKILIAGDGYFYGEKVIDCKDKIAKVVESVPSIKQVVLVPYILKENSSSHYITWAEALENDAKEIEFTQLPFDHPVYIMYSSGTTGVPKCMVHGAGGTLLQHAKELKLHCDLDREDTIFYYTTCGWMMWNWLASSLMCGAHIVLYDGNPLWPEPDILWKMSEEQKITIFGTSAKYIALCMKNNLRPKDKYNLEPLKALLSTGSPLSTDSFEWIYENVKKDLHLASISGGTDIVSCFILGDPTSPVYSGEVQKKGLGMKVEAWDENGKSVLGKKGELVCTKPFPSMPIYFWNDKENKKYRSAYFDYYPGIWRHGDFIEITKNNGIIVHGRSDATLNPGGIRLGTAELYKAAESLPQIQDSIAIGQHYKDDVRIILFVVLAEKCALNETLKQEIKSTIRSQASHHHVPAKIIQVPEIPTTINGKKVEMAVSNIVHGKEVKNKDSLANPEALDYFSNLTELTEEQSGLVHGNILKVQLLLHLKNQT